MHGSLSVVGSNTGSCWWPAALPFLVGIVPQNQALQSPGVSWSRLQHTCGELVLGILPCVCAEPTLTLEPVPAAASPRAPRARAPHFHAVGTAGACKVTASTSTTPGTLGGTTFPAKPCSSPARCFQHKCCFQLIPQPRSWAGLALWLSLGLTAGRGTFRAGCRSCNPQQPRQGRNTQLWCLGVTGAIYLIIWWDPLRSIVVSWFPDAIFRLGFLLNVSSFWDFSWAQIWGHG